MLVKKVIILIQQNINNRYNSNYHLSLVQNLVAFFFSFSLQTHIKKISFASRHLRQNKSVITYYYDQRVKFNSTLQAKQSQSQESEKNNFIQYGYRKCTTHAQMSSTIPHSNSKNETDIKEYSKQIREKERSKVYMKKEVPQVYQTAFEHTYYWGSYNMKQQRNYLA